MQLPTELESRFQDNVSAAVDSLAAAQDVLAVSLASLAVSASIQPGTSAVFYRGKPGAALALPAASAQGAGVAALVVVGNLSSGNVTLQATGKDTVNGGRSIVQATGTVRMFVSDGASAWLATP